MEYTLKFNKWKTNFEITVNTHYDYMVIKDLTEKKELYIDNCNLCREFDSHYRKLDVMGIGLYLNWFFQMGFDELMTVKSV